MAADVVPNIEDLLAQIEQDERLEAKSKVVDALPGPDKANHQRGPVSGYSLGGVPESTPLLIAPVAVLDDYSIGGVPERTPLLTAPVTTLDETGAALPSLEELLAELDAAEMPQVATAGSVAPKISKAILPDTGLPKRLAPKVELPKTVAPRAEVPKHDSPKAFPKVPVPKAQLPTADAQKAELAKAMSVKELKLQLTQLRVDFSGATEKCELVALLEEAETAKVSKSEVPNAAAQKCKAEVPLACAQKGNTRLAKWQQHLVTQIDERLTQVTSSHHRKQMQKQVYDNIVSSELMEGQPEALKGLEGGYLKVRLQSTSAQLASGEVAFCLEPSMEDQFPEDTPEPSELVNMFQGNPAWRSAPRKMPHPNGAPLGEQGVPLPSCVIPATAPDSVVPKGRRLINVEFYSCTSWPHGYLSKQLLYAAMHAREQEGSPLVFKVSRRPMALSPEEAQMESVPIGKRLWFSWHKSRSHGEELLDLLGERYDIKYCWKGMTSTAWDSLRLVLWAQTLGLNEEFMAALGWRHFGRAARLADHAVLADAAEEAGLDREQAMAVLKSERYSAELQQGMKKWQKDITMVDTGLSALPCFIFRSTNPEHTEVERLQGSLPQSQFEEVFRKLEAQEKWSS